MSEPLPTRLASTAMRTGDMDCIYHAALYELAEAAEESGNEDQAEVLQTLVSGRRLRNISDVTLALAIWRVQIPGWPLKEGLTETESRAGFHRKTAWENWVVMPPVGVEAARNSRSATILRRPPNPMDKPL